VWRTQSRSPTILVGQGPTDSVTTISNPDVEDPLCDGYGL
jgi:hypothetical protein